jgi:hypothetical protein
MDTAISLDINIFLEAERAADHLRVSVPELCTMAIQEYLKNNQKSEITKQLDDFYSTQKAYIDNDILQAQYDLLGEEEWEW